MLQATLWVSRQTQMFATTPRKRVSLAPLVVSAPYEHPDTLWDEALVATGDERARDVITRGMKLSSGVYWVHGARCGGAVDLALTDLDGTVYAVTTRPLEEEGVKQTDGVGDEEPEAAE